MLGLGLLFQILILCLILGLVIYIFHNVPILAPFVWLANVICVVIVVIFLIEVLLGLSGGSAVMWHLR
jgi:uncharacterized membrane protein YjdF